MSEDGSGEEGEETKNRSDDDTESDEEVRKGVKFDP